MRESSVAKVAWGAPSAAGAAMGVTSAAETVGGSARHRTSRSRCAAVPARQAEATASAGLRGSRVVRTAGSVWGIAPSESCASSVWGGKSARRGARDSMARGRWSTASRSAPRPGVCGGSCGWARRARRAWASTGVQGGTAKVWAAVAPSAATWVHARVTPGKRVRVAETASRRSALGRSSVSSQMTSGGSPSPGVRPTASRAAAVSTLRVEAAERARPRSQNTDRPRACSAVAQRARAWLLPTPAGPASWIPRVGSPPRSATTPPSAGGPRRPAGGGSRRPRGLSVVLRRGSGARSGSRAR